MGEPGGRSDREGGVAAAHDAAAPGLDGESVLAELRESGLALDRLPGNTAKIRLLLDLAAELRARERLRVLDVGCAGPDPLNLWRPFLPLAGRLELVGVDVAGLDATASRARELGLPVELRRVDAAELPSAFARESFDAVVSTQVLEHLRDWRAGLAAMAAVVARGGGLFATCDSADLRRPAGERARLAAKRAYARLRAARSTPSRPAHAGVPSGQWERGLHAEDIREALTAAGLVVDRVAPYCVRDLKVAQRRGGTATRVLWLALEETLAAEAGGAVAAERYAVLYVRARRPAVGLPGPSAGA